MKKLLNTEHNIIIVLWTLLLFSCSYALAKGYTITFDFYIGFIGLIVLSVIAFIRPKWLVVGLLLLLSIGIFNLASFLYFYNWYFSLGLGKLGIIKFQLLSLFFLVILLIKSKSLLAAIVSPIFKKNEAHKKSDELVLQEQFKQKFQHLSNREIQKRLGTKLVPEARQALLDILVEREKE